MKKHYLFLALGLSLLGGVQAQTTVNDSIETGGGYANDVYYSFATGTVATAPNSNWQLAFAMDPMSVSVRANTGVSQTNDGLTEIYEMPGVDLNWAPFDTTGYKTWAKRNNSHTDWEGGALNYPDPTNPVDFGWGEYIGAPSHAVVGHRLYLAVVTSGSTTMYKKIWIRDKTMGNWNISFANIDGTDSVGFTIAYSAYMTKNFVYVSLVTGAIVDREPAKTAWDFVYTRYQPTTPNFPVVTGMLTNGAVTTSKVTGKEETTTTLADTTTFSENMSTIGSDWKTHIGGGVYKVADSVTYFVKATDGFIWKLVFTNFTPATGKAVFNKTKMILNTGVATIGEEVKSLMVYPNPTSGELTVMFEAQSVNSTVILTDITGKSVYNKNIESSLFTTHTIDVAAFGKGIYFLNVINGNSRSVQKVIVN